MNRSGGCYENSEAVVESFTDVVSQIIIEHFQNKKAEHEVDNNEPEKLVWQRRGTPAQ